MTYAEQQGIMPAFDAFGVVVHDEFGVFRAVQLSNLEPCSMTNQEVGKEQSSE